VKGEDVESIEPHLRRWSQKAQMASL